MPKQIYQNELDVIVNTVAKFPDGVPLGKIMESLSIPISRRNVQHRLVFLVKNGLLRAEGKARAIMSLHEGNIARHRIRDVEYETWQKT